MDSVKRTPERIEDAGRARRTFGAELGGFGDELGGHGDGLGGLGDQLGGPRGFNAEDSGRG